MDRGNTSNGAQGMGEFNLWDHFNENAVGTINTCAHQPDIGTGRPEFSQYEKAFTLHTGRTLTWYAIEQGFRSVLAMLREVDGLLITEEGGKTYVQKKTMED
ncbi:hypothetical protein AAVH_39423, partial [Aphelenchoides avenae]